jgi:hypothetical protein
MSEAASGFPEFLLAPCGVIVPASFWFGVRDDWAIRPSGGGGSPLRFAAQPPLKLENVADAPDKKCTDGHDDEPRVADIGFGNSTPAARSFLRQKGNRREGGRLLVFVG